MTENIQRKPDVAEIAPEPQTLHALDNTISERLLSLQRREHEKPAPIASINTPNPVSKPKLAGVDTKLSRPKAESLVRREGTASTPIELSRSKSRIQKADVLVAPPTSDRPTRAPAQTSDASRELAGARMTGPVADRPIVSYESPDYPEWAKTEGVEGSVMIYFVVLADGRVKENVMVQRTSGFADFDQNAVSAILAWRFERLDAGKTGEQWGTILFHYRLRSVN
jgi:TonB family protein